MKYPVWLALVLLFGCSADEVGESESASKTGSSIEAAVLPERDGENSKTAPTNWKEGLPAGPVRAQVGEKVLVIKPTHEWGAKPELATVKSIEGETATVSGKYRQEQTGVRSALIHPAAAFASKQPFQVGQVVFSIGGLVNGVTRVSKVKGDRVWVQGMFMEDVREERPDFVMRFPPKGTFLFRRLRFEHPRHGTRMGLCLAESDQWVWVRDETGHMYRAEKNDVSDLPDPVGGFAVSDVVETYTVDGFGKGKVLEVLNDGLRYMVAVESRKEPVKVHFASVLRKLEE